MPRLILIMFALFFMSQVNAEDDQSFKQCRTNMEFAARYYFNDYHGLTSGKSYMVVKPLLPLRYFVDSQQQNFEAVDDIVQYYEKMGFPLQRVYYQDQANLVIYINEKRKLYRLIDQAQIDSERVRPLLKSVVKQNDCPRIAQHTDLIRIKTSIFVPRDVITKDFEGYLKKCLYQHLGQGFGLTKGPISREGFFRTPQDFDQPTQMDRFFLKLLADGYVGHSAFDLRNEAKKPGSAVYKRIDSYCRGEEIDTVDEKSPSAQEDAVDEQVSLLEKHQAENCTYNCDPSVNWLQLYWSSLSEKNEKKETPWVNKCQDEISYFDQLDVYFKNEPNKEKRAQAGWDFVLRLKRLFGDDLRKLNHDNIDKVSELRNKTGSLQNCVVDLTSSLFSAKAAMEIRLADNSYKKCLITGLLSLNASICRQKNINIFDDVVGLLLKAVTLAFKAHEEQDQEKLEEAIADAQETIARVLKPYYFQPVYIDFY